ncbi:hypothetical protein DFQ27_009484 [Actinomortierella ambigua]|uniref:Dopey N-terminal domain-containing protein n=1 Tax=Actinomortierella ambigua TaxID=1343610 RepID=A0A9P6QIM3_9FUNG|nr:hypothetical protein DFQ27_009484 [Actinomortierella ambigua]
MNDPRYKKYVQLVERNLQSFDNVNEWADVNPFLSKIMRSFQAYPQYTVIPRTLTVAKRLAQCLNPALPAGVHGKTLEVYAYIFKTIGPQLLDIYEEYYLPLRERLKPCLKSFIIGLLPGLDEEGSEFFDRVLGLLDNLRRAVDEAFFFQCMWLIMISSAQHRGPALNYISRRMPHLTNTEDVAFVLGEDAGLMVRAFSATVGDSQLLVQRAMLDIMVVHFPISNGLIEERDLVLLVKAAVGVVLRKDMSLNRRLYAWLLGQQEGKKKIFAGPAKSALITGIQSMLNASHQELAEGQKPFKVFVSLLDEWDIGYPVIQSVFLDALKSLKRHVDMDDHGSELIQAAKIWIDITDPYLIWKKLAEAVYEDFPALNDNHEPYALDLVIFFMTYFETELKEEETQHMHMPMFLLIILTKLQEVAMSGGLLQSSSQVEKALSLCLMLLRNIPPAVFTPISPQALQAAQTPRSSKSKPSTPTPILPPHDEQPSTNDTTQPAQSKIVVFEPHMSAKSYIEEFYVLTPRSPEATEGSVSKEYVGIRGQALSQQTLSFIQQFISHVVRACINDTEGLHTPTYRPMIEKTCKILTILSKHKVQAKDFSHFSGEWLDVLRECCSKATDFVIVDAVVSTLIELTLGHKVIDHSFLDNPRHTRQIVDRIWSFYDDDYMHLHLRVTQLIWLLQELTSVSHECETVIASYLVVEDSKTRMDAFQKFGVFWRLSDDLKHSSPAFVRPMMLLLDSLSSTNPANRRAGETWIRSNLKSYPRLLDPLLLVLADEAIVRNKTEETIHNEYFPVYYYVQNFNQAQVHYVFNVLLTIFRFGGLGFLRSLRTSTIPHNISPVIMESLAMDDSKQPPTYLECFVKLALRFIESEPLPEFSIMLLPNEEIHMLSADFLHFIVSKIDFLESAQLALIHKTVIVKMLFCINHNRLDLQSRLLHLLHATILMGNTTVKKPGSQSMHGAGLHRDGSHAQLESSSPSVSTASPNGDPSEAMFRIVGSSPLFVKTVFDALSVPTNRPILQHWMDFLMLALPFMGNYYRKVLQPVIQCLCDQILRCRVSLLEAYADRVSTRGSRAPNLTDQDLMIFLTGLERMLTFSLTEARLGDDVDPIHRQEWSDGLRGTPGLVANVLGIEVHPSDSFQENRARETILYNIVSILQILIELWSVFDVKNMKAMSSTETVSLQFSGERIRARIKRILAGLYKSFPSEVTEGFIELFLAENPSVLDLENSKVDPDRRTIEILSVVPGASPLAIFLTLLESVRVRTQGMPVTRSKRSNLRITKATDIVLLRIIEVYCTHVTSKETLTELWPLCLNFVREFLPQATNFKYAFPSLLRVMTVLCDRIAYMPYFEDRKVRRDSCDVYQRVLDYCILIAGRSFDQGIWLRTRNPQDLEVLDESEDMRESSSSRPPSSLSEIDTTTTKRQGKTKEDALIQQVQVSLVQLVIPNLRRILQEQDRIMSIITNLVYYVIGPAFKNRGGGGGSVSSVAGASAAGDALLLDILVEISKIPSAYRSWRKEAWEVFLDNRFFTMTPGLARRWRVLIQCAMTTEKERLVELLGRISTSPSSTLFTSRDQESLNRALMLRRLSFVIWCGTLDQYLPQLPLIQEKLVELLKLSSTEQVHPEIYLCLRVMLCRISSQHLNNFWPVLLTELISLFSTFLNDEVDRPEQTQLFLAACKFLDLLFVLENGHYFIHQWIFISDSIYNTVMNSPMGDPMPVALMDRMGKKIFEESPLEGYAGLDYNNSPQQQSQQQTQQQTSQQQYYQQEKLQNSAVTGDDVDEDIDSWFEKQQLRRQDDENQDRLSTNASELTMTMTSDVERMSLAHADAMAASPHDGTSRKQLAQQQYRQQQQQQQQQQPATAAFKRPMLTMRSIRHVRELESFLTHIAQYVYQTTYSLAKPDRQFIEALLERDMLSGAGLEEST